MSEVPASSDPLSSPRRLASLAATRLMNTERDEVFDRLTRLASSVLGVPIAAMTLLDAERQFVKSGVGLGDFRVGPARDSFCQHAVRSRAPFIVEDSHEHPLVKDNPGSVRAYAGMPLSVDEGETLGAFCIADEKPRVWTERELAILRDLSAAVESQISAHKSAVESEQRRQLLETVIHTMGSGLMVMDGDRQLTLVNAHARRMLDPQALESPIEERPARFGLYHADGRELVRPDELPLARAARGEDVDDYDMVVRPPHQPGKQISVSVAARPLPTGGAVMVIHDMTERRELERKARLNETLYHKLANNIPNAAVYLVSPTFEILLAEGMLLQTVGVNAQALVGKSMKDVSDPPNWARTEAALRACFEGRTATFDVERAGRAFEAHCQPVYEGTDVVAAISIYFDVTERERTAARLADQSVRDDLTGLLNRRGFIQRGQRVLNAVEWGDRAPILFFVDLNGMKPINDQLGHHEGDRALTDTAHLLEKCFPTPALIARLGGDEFVVLVGNPGERSPTSYERELRACIGKFNDSLTRLYRVSVSVGYTQYDASAPRTIEQLLNAADAQMYAAKRARQERGNISLPPPSSR